MLPTILRASRCTYVISGTLHNEIEDNLSFYSDKITSDTDISGELDEYKREKKYNKDVDLILYALANSISTVSIYYVHDGVIKTHEIPCTNERWPSIQKACNARSCGRAL